MLPSRAATAAQSFSSPLASPAVVPERSGVFAAHNRPRWTAAAAGALVLVGVVGVAPAALTLGGFWVTDPTKSIGALVPFVSLGLILRAWFRSRCPLAGSWWGLALLAATMLAVRLRESAVCELVLSRSLVVALPPLSLIAVCYAAGVVLLLGGPQLLRAARFPVLFMAAVNPVPKIVLRHLDLPLQHASAHVARSFAHAAGASLNPGQLQLMFTPAFGMFIAPGCDGIRGAVTMGLLALVAGHLHGFRRRTWLALVAGGVALGYIFNLVRLCALVLYYLVALRLPWLQDHAESADYLLGGGLFFVAAWLLFSAVRRWRRPEAETERPPGDLPDQGRPFPAGDAPLRRPFALHAVALAALVAVAAAPYTRDMARNIGDMANTAPGTVSAASGAGGKPAALFPQRLGDFELRRTWEETLTRGVLLYHWAEYATPAGAAVSVGVSPTMGAHDTLLCHLARGEDWLWLGELPLRIAHGDATVSFSGAFFNNGVMQLLEASTLCTGDTCGQHTEGVRPGCFGSRVGLGLIYSHVGRDALLGRATGRPLPLLVQVESLDEAAPPDATRLRLTETLQQFMAAVDPALLVRSAR